MAHIVAARVWETSTTTGTGAFTLGGAVTGYRAFSAVCATSDTVPYIIEAVDGSGNPTGDWEAGVGTYSATNTLTRTTVYESSNAGAAVAFGAGTKNVFLGLESDWRAAQRLDAGTVTASTPFSWSQTWNNVSSAFKGITASITDTASSASSRLLDLIVGGTSKLWVRKDGGLVFGPSSGTTTGIGSTEILACNVGNGQELQFISPGYSANTKFSWDGGGGCSLQSTSNNRLTIYTNINLELSSNGATAYVNLKVNGTNQRVYGAVTVASLPAAATAGAYARAFATDASSPTFGSVVSGGGSTLTPVYCDGTNWRVG